MRVISGWAKGIKLVGVPGKSTRPITDRVKEALFNILSTDVAGTTWLDLFGGTGAVGIEALSRDAPPQYQGIWVKAMQALDDNPGWLAENGTIIVQIHPKEYSDDIAYANFVEFDQRNYGDTRLVFYRRRSDE
jgi:16S rRNA G966 N2-methylase RsmD